MKIFIQSFVVSGRYHTIKFCIMRSASFSIRLPSLVDLVLKKGLFGLDRNLRKEPHN